MAKQAPPEAPEASEAPKAETPPPASTGHRFFAWIRSLGLVRQPGWIGGVSAGIADRIGVDVLIVRGVLVVVAVLGGPAVLLYALAWLVLPDAHDRIHLEDLLRGKVESPIVAIAVLIALSLLPFAQGFWWFGSVYWSSPDWGGSVGRAIWTIVILGLLIWFVVWFARRSQRDGSTITGNGGVHHGTTNHGHSHATTTMPATTDDRPSTIPAAPVTAPTAPLPAPAAGATPDEIAAWRESQAQWKTDHEAFRQQQAAERQAVNQAATLAARTERVARALEYREERARTRSNPLYSAALIGIALIAGAITALMLGDGAPEPLDYLAGIAVAIGTLGLGIILNGALGRRSGGASGMAAVLLVPLLLAGIFPQSDTLRYSGTSTHVLHQEFQNEKTDYFQVTGNTTVNLADYFALSSSRQGNNGSYDTVRIWVASGDVTVIVPTEEWEYLSAQTASGTVTAVNGTEHKGSWNARLTPSGNTDFNSDSPGRELDVSVYVASGDVHFAEAGANS